MMKKLLALLTAVLLMVSTLLSCAALPAGHARAAEPADPVLVYGAGTPWPFAVLLPGMPYTVQWTGDEWIDVAYPYDGSAGETARMRRGTEPGTAMDSSHWPEAEVIVDTAFDSIDLNLYSMDLPKGTRVKVAGRCASAWYVLVEDSGVASFGAVRLDDLAVDADTAALLNGMLPDFPIGSDEVLARIDALEKRGCALAEQYGVEDENLWPQEVREDYDVESWALGFYWQDAYAVPYDGAAMTAEEAETEALAYLTGLCGMPLPAETPMRAQYLLVSGVDNPYWRVYIDLDDSYVPLTVIAPADQGGVLMDPADRLRLYEGLGLPLGEGLMPQAEAKALAWQYAAQELNIAGPGGARLILDYCSAGAVLTYDWPRESWCDDRPVFRANFYSADDTGVLGEIWFDAESGEIYRVSAESSGMG